MMTWNKPEVEELNVNKTAGPKPSQCEGVPTNGTCTYWCNGANFGPCDYYPGNRCRLKKNGSTTPTPTPEGTFDFS